MDIKAFWNNVINQNKEKLSTYFNNNALILWPCTNEQFTVEEYIRVNCEYPGSWNGDIERLEKHEDEYIVVGHVYSKDGTISCHVVSFIKTEKGKIAHMVEYWADDEDAPEWRKEMNIGKQII